MIVNVVNNNYHDLGFINFFLWVALDSDLKTEWTKFFFDVYLKIIKTFGLDHTSTTEDMDVSMISASSIRNPVFTESLFGQNAKDREATSEQEDEEAPPETLKCAVLPPPPTYDACVEQTSPTSSMSSVVDNDDSSEDHYNAQHRNQSNITMVASLPPKFDHPARSTPELELLSMSRQSSLAASEAEEAEAAIEAEAAAAAAAAQQFEQSETLEDDNYN